jgi:ribosomal protein L11 methyltransferase
MGKYFKISVKASSSDESEILIAKLSEISFYAFEEENNLLNAYVKEEDFEEDKLKNILSPKSIYSKHVIEEENWNQQWEAGLEPVIINDFAAIRASFHGSVKNVKHELIITPKMSFGTGHHATTYLMIELMEKLDFKSKTVVDFGTGTGVLSILAEKCGASEVIAVDYDEWSINNVKENVAFNHCCKIIIRQQNSLSGISTADIILANINLNALKSQSLPISSMLKKNGLLLASGFYSKDEEEMLKTFEENSLVKVRFRQKDDWLAILFKKI